jgi:hypothetical protein
MLHAPVDIVSRYIIAKAFGNGSDKNMASSSEDNYNAMPLSQTPSSAEFLAHSDTPAESLLARTETPDKSSSMDTTNESEKGMFKSW